MHNTTHTSVPLAKDSLLRFEFERYVYDCWCPNFPKNQGWRMQQAEWGDTYGIQGTMTGHELHNQVQHQHRKLG